MVRSTLLVTALLAATIATAFAQGRDQVSDQGRDRVSDQGRDRARDDAVAAPVLRANVAVSGNVVRIGDVIDNAGVAAQIAIYRAPDLGTTGSLPTAQILATLRAHQVIGVDTRDISEISITRLARTIEVKDIEFEVARALAHRKGLGDAPNLSVKFDGDVQDMRLEATNTGAMQPASVRFESRNNRFDIIFEIANENTSTPTRLHFTGSAIETIETSVLTRDVERGEVLKPTDVTVERRPKAEVGPDVASRDRAIGMQMRKQLRAGQPLKIADVAKPDLVLRDQNVTLTYETAGLYLTIRGKALESGAQGDVVNVVNLQSKRTVSGVVIGREQVAISVATPRLSATADANETTASIAQTASNNSSAAPKPE